MDSTTGSWARVIRFAGKQVNARCPLSVVRVCPETRPLTCRIGGGEESLIPSEPRALATGQRRVGDSLAVRHRSPIHRKITFPSSFSESLRILRVCFSGRARLPPSRDVTIRTHLCRLALLRRPIPAIPFNKLDPPAPRAAQRELRPPIRCGHSPLSVRPFRGRGSGQTLRCLTGCQDSEIVTPSPVQRGDQRCGIGRPSSSTADPSLTLWALIRGRSGL